MANNFLEDARKRMDVQGTVQGAKQVMKNKSQSMVKPLNSGSTLASPYQKSSAYKFANAKGMAKGKK